MIGIVLYHSEEVFFTSRYLALKDHGRQFNSFFKVSGAIKHLKSYLKCSEHTAVNFNLVVSCSAVKSVCIVGG